MSRYLFRCLPLILALSLAPLVSGQTAPSAESSQQQGRELRLALRDHFRTRLRVELALSDDQVEQLLPRVERMEQLMTDSRRERGELLRRLRQRLRDGATDVELQELLVRLQQLDRETRSAEQAGREQIDELLSVRQQVQYLFFTQQFRRELQQQIQRLRQQQGDGGPRSGRGRRPPATKRP